MAFGDLISLSYAKTIANISQSDTSSDVRLSALITACSYEATAYCGRKFYPSYYDELYNGSGCGYLVLRTSPLISLSQVIIGPSTTQPQTYAAGSFDLDPTISKITFKPTVVASFFYDSTTSLAFPSGINTTEAQYFGGYGALISSTAIASGVATVTPSAMFGLTPNGDMWSLAAGTSVIVDPGLQTQELISVTSVSSTTFSATFARAHTNPVSMLVPVIPTDLQSAVGFMVSNLMKQVDQTKQSERLDQYAATLRDNARGIALTPEVLGILNRYKSVFSG